MQFLSCHYECSMIYIVGIEKKIYLTRKYGQFKYALREENRLLFTKMLEECQKQGENRTIVG